MNAPARLDIAIVSDVVCPWCHVGHGQLQQALAAWAEQHPEQAAPRLRWYPFQLNPDMPAVGMPRAEYMAAKFGHSDLGPIHERLEAAARAAGVQLQLARITRQPNTLKAHTLIHLAADGGDGQTAMARALFRAYFEQGCDLTDEAQLRAAASAAGLAPAAVDTALGSAVPQDQVAQLDANLRQQGVGGVPLFVFTREGTDHQAVVSGAQGRDALLQAMTQCMTA
jgi:predicted DsbA family dithiol-disulfide isomerase